MRIFLKYLCFFLLCLTFSISCMKRQEIALYEEGGEVIPAADSLYNRCKKLYKDTKYQEVIIISKDALQKHPTSEKADDILYLLLLSHYRLRDYKGVVSAALGKVKFYRKRDTEPEINYIIAQSYRNLNNNYEAAKYYFNILELPADSELKEKAENKLTKLLESRLTFKEMEELIHKYGKSSIGCFLFYNAVKRGIKQGMQFEARKVYGKMKKIYPDNTLTKEVGELLEREKIGQLSGAIGFLAPLSGEYSIFGKMVKNGFELALQGTNYKIIERDTKGDPIETIKQVVNLIKNENVFVTIGPVLSMPMIAAAGIANMLEIPIISPTATEEDISSIGPYVFQINVGLGAQAREMAKYATGKLDYSKFAILYPDDAYGNSLASIFTEEAARLGGQIVAKQSYPEGTTDFKHQMLFIKEKKPEAIYIPCYPQDAIMIAPQLKYYKIRAKVLGANGWYDKIVPVQGEAYVERVIFTGSPTAIYQNTETFKNFRREYYTRFKCEPTRESALAYDTGALLLKALAKGAKDSESLAKILQEIEPFAGTSGIVNPRGYFEGKVPFYTIRNGEIVKYK
jgi:branched-chain amino acid transport system substrate-binding protein